MHKTRTITATFLLATLTAACGSSEPETPNMNLRVFAPIEDTKTHKTTAKVSMQDTDTGDYFILKEIPVINSGDIRIDEESIQGLLVELADAASGLPLYSMTLYFDQNRAVQPVDLNTALPVGQEFTIRMQLVNTADDVHYPGVYEKILRAPRVPMPVHPIETVR